MHIHFHSSDARCCGSKGSPRRFTVDSNEVNCPECKDKDQLCLTPRAIQYLKDMGYARVVDGKLVIS